VPLGEEHQAYVVQVRSGDRVLREEIATTPEWTYSAAKRNEDGTDGRFVIEVAQLSARYGTGPFTNVKVGD